MPTLFIRTIVVYLLVFTVVRLMGKRQISDMQPFDLVITLLIADLAAVPISDAAIPLLYGVIPILALFILHRIVAYFALKSESIRSLVCGNPLVIIANGQVMEDAMRAASYTLNDLIEQLRIKDVFSISQVEYAILETNGSLSVLMKSQFQQPTAEQLDVELTKAIPAYLLVTDGKLHDNAIIESGMDKMHLQELLKGLGYHSEKDCLFVSLDPDGLLHVQGKQKSSNSCKIDYVEVSNSAKTYTNRE